MAGKLIALSFLASVASALPYQGAAPAPAEKRADCTVTTLGYVTPTCGGTEVVPVTYQGQPCTTYSPTAYVCNGAACATQYATSTYNWYSTYVPCAQGLCFCDRGDTYVTLPPQPQATSYTVASMYCETAGYYTAGGQEYYVSDCPSYLYYAVPYSSSYHQCAAEDYFQWLYGGGAGVSLDVDYITCVDNVCTQALQTWTYSVGTELQWVDASFSGFCSQSGPCELSAYVPGYGSVSITINISISSPGMVTTSTSAQVTVTTTATSTVTATTTVSASASATATVAPGAFVLAVTIPNAARMAKRATSKTLGYISSLDGLFRLTTVASEALTFGLSAGGSLFSGTDLTFASQADVTAGFFDVEIGTPATGDFTQSFSLSGGNSGILVWINPVFTSASDAASFCIIGDRVIGVYNGVPPTNCLPVQLTAESGAVPISSSSSASGQSSTMTSSQSSETGSTSSTATSAGASSASSSASATQNSSSASATGNSSSASATQNSSAASASASSAASASASASQASSSASATQNSSSASVTQSSSSMAQSSGASSSSSVVPSSSASMSSSASITSAPSSSSSASSSVSMSSSSSMM